MSASAAGSQHGVCFIPEVTWGVTPGTPQMVSLRNTGCTLDVKKSTMQSAEIRSDRAVSDLRHGLPDPAGAIPFELSFKEYDPLLEAALFGAFTANVLKRGVTPKAFTIERQFTDIAQYGVFIGCMVDKFSLDIKPNAMVTGSFDMIGKSASYSDTPLDASPTASQTASPYDTFTGSVKEGGVTIGIVTGIQLSIANNLAKNLPALQNAPNSVSAGRAVVTGNIDVFFQDLVMLNKFLNETVSSLEFTLGNGITGSYTFMLPKIKYTGADNSVNNEGTIQMKMPFQSILDSVTGTDLQITRTAT